MVGLSALACRVPHFYPITTWRLSVLADSPGAVWSERSRGEGRLEGLDGFEFGFSETLVLLDLKRFH